MKNVRHWCSNLVSPFWQINHCWSSWRDRMNSGDTEQMIKWLVENSPGYASDSNLSCLLQNPLLPGSWLIFVPNMPVLSWLPSLNDIIFKCLGWKARNRHFSCQKFKHISKSNILDKLSNKQSCLPQSRQVWGLLSTYRSIIVTTMAFQPRLCICSCLYTGIQADWFG